MQNNAGKLSVRALGMGLLGLALAGMAPASVAGTIKLTVTIENLAPAGGNWLTPFWVAFQDGSFELFTPGSPASAGLEALAEDGNAGPLSAEFLGSGAGTVDGVIAGPGGPIAPGDLAVATFMIDPSDPGSQYFSFAAMVLPSNDAFVATAQSVSLFDGSGNFVGLDMFLTGAQVYDAGTEVNDELPMNTAFFGQTMPNTGEDEFGVVGPHPGFLPAGSGGILDDPMFANADFTRAGYPIAQIRVSAVPVPGALLLMMSGLLGLGFMKRR